MKASDRLHFLILALPATTAFPGTSGNANLRTFHCLHDCPVGAPTNDDVVVRKIYTLASNPIAKLPVRRTLPAAAS